MDIEKELTMRVFLHKVAILKSAIANSYIVKEKKKGGIMLAEPCLEQLAIDYADNKVQHILFAGRLDEAYEEAWELVSKHMPDNFSII